jgi:hypothetical protein
MILEPYVLFKQTLLIKSEAGTLGDALVTSPWVPITGKLRGGFDYTGEGLVQHGSYSTDRVSARAGTVSMGWMAAVVSWMPRLNVEYNYASGDPGAKDGNRNTFDQFYPSNHSYYGMIDQFGWKNMKNYRFGMDFVVRKQLKVRGDFNEFYLATTQDSLFASSGSSAVLNRKADSAHAGSGIGGVAL